MLLDDDVLVKPGLAAAHARHHAGRPDLVVMGYYPVAPQCLRSGGTPARLYSQWYEAQVPTWTADPQSVLRGLWGGHVSLRREVALAVPPGAAAFYAPTNQDRDWGLRLLKAGYVGRFDPTLRTDHLYQRSVDEFLRTHGRSGAGTWLVHHLHADVIGHLLHDHYFQHLSGARRRVVRLARRPRSGTLIAAAALVARASQRRAAIETALSMAQQRAALQASRAHQAPAQG